MTLFDNLNQSNVELQTKLLVKNSVFRKLPTTEQIYDEIRYNRILNENKFNDRLRTNLIVAGYYSTILEALEKRLENSGTMNYSLREKIEESKEVINEFSRQALGEFRPPMRMQNSGLPLPVQERSKFVDMLSGFTVTSTFLYFSGLVSTLASALTLGLAIPSALLFAFTFLVPKSSSRKVKDSVDSFAKSFGEVLNVVLQIPNHENSETLEALLDDLEISPLIKEKFKNDDTFSVISGMTQFCNTKVRIMSEEEVGKPIDIKNVSVVREIIQRITLTLVKNEHRDKYVFEFRKCILGRLIDLYKLIFIGIFIKYMEYGHTKKVISSSYSTKMLFTYFQNVSKVDRTFKLRFESLIKLRNLIEGYPELIEKTEDMSQNYKDELVKFIKNELKTADKELDKAIKNNIDKFEYEQAKKAFVNSAHDMKTLSTFLDPIKKQEIELKKQKKLMEFK